MHGGRHRLEPGERLGRRVRVELQVRGLDAVSDLQVGHLRLHLIAEAVVGAVGADELRVATFFGQHAAAEE